MYSPLSGFFSELITRSVTTVVVELSPALPVLDMSHDPAGLTDDQIAVLSVLQTDVPTLTDDAALLTDLPVRRVLSALTVLEIDGYVSRQGTRSFLRTVELKKE